MIERGAGTILLTGGDFALHPHPDYLSLSIGKAGIRALAQGLFESFKEKEVHVATVTVAGFVDPASQDANTVADQFWQLHSQPKEAWTVEAVYAPWPAKPGRARALFGVRFWPLAELVAGRAYFC